MATVFYPGGFMKIFNTDTRLKLKNFIYLTFFLPVILTPFVLAALYERDYQTTLKNVLLVFVGFVSYNMMITIFMFIIGNKIRKTFR